LIDMILREQNVDDCDYIREHPLNETVFDKEPAEIYFLVTIEEDGIPLATGGIKMENTTTASCWLCLSKDAQAHIIEVYRTIRVWLDKIAKEKGIKRLQAYVDCSFKQGIRILEHLGFEFEHKLENFFGDKPADLYRRFI